MKIKIAGITNESVVDGPGIRMVVFCQGCPHHCADCQNPETHDPDGGKWDETENILQLFFRKPLLSGITLSGGEPLSQSGACAEIAAKVKQMGKDIIIYTGYTWEEIIRRKEKEKDLQKLLKYTDILVDGPFIEAQKDLNLAFRGSKNQRVIDVPTSLREGSVKEIKWGREKSQ